MNHEDGVSLVTGDVSERTVEVVDRTSALRMFCNRLKKLTDISSTARGLL